MIKDSNDRTIEEGDYVDCILEVISKRAIATNRDGKLMLMFSGDPFVETNSKAPAYYNVDDFYQIEKVL